ncbi:MAG: hypothetical protein WBD10_02345 [Acidobacteriaceae bacterium]
MLKIIEFGLLAGVLAVVVALIVSGHRSRSNPTEVPPPLPGDAPETPKPGDTA